MKYYIIAGEASGDLHASNLASELFKIDKQAEIRGCGGKLMENQGVSLLMNYNRMSFMGFVEVLRNIRIIIDNFKKVKKDIIYFQPNSLILVDYPGFNLRIAKFAKKQGFKVFYYISPKFWAWNESRVEKVKAYIDKMFVILPFEKDFYDKHNYSVEYVGHPLLDAFDSLQVFEKKNYIALLPGSRRQEVKRMLPIMLSVAEKHKDKNFVIAAVPTLGNDFYLPYLKNNNVKIEFENTYKILKQCKAAMVTSGTATLEAALADAPQVVCYKANCVSYLIAKLLIKVRFISLPNLIMNKEIVKELIQKQLNTNNLNNELMRIIDSDIADKIRNNYKMLVEKLGNSGASKKTAQLIYEHHTLFEDGKN